MRRYALAALVCGVVSLPASALAAPITPTLASLILNVDGNVYDSVVDGPAVPGTLGGATINAAGFDSATGLGTLVFQIGGAGIHTVLGYFDIDWTEDNQFDNDSASVAGVPAAGESWEIDTFDGDIVNHSYDSTAGLSLLSNSNDLGGSADVALAIAQSFFLSPGETAFIQFIGADDIGAAAGFRLLAFDQTSLTQYALSSVLRIEPAQAEPVPEPGTLLLFGTGIAGVARTLKRRRHS